MHTMAAEIHAFPPAVQNGRDPLQDAQLADLLARMGRADVEALASFYDLTLGRVWALVSRIIRDDQAIEGAVARIYETAWSSASSYHAAQGPVLLWLLKIARTEALGMSCRPGGAATAASAARQAGFEERHVDELLDVFDPTAPESVALRMMPAHQKSIVLLVLFRGMGWAQIAGELRLPMALIAQEFDLALRHLRRLRVAACGEARVLRLLRQQA